MAAKNLTAFNIMVVTLDRSGEDKGPTVAIDSSNRPGQGVVGIARTRDNEADEEPVPRQLNVRAPSPPPRSPSPPVRSRSPSIHQPSPPISPRLPTPSPPPPQPSKDRAPNVAFHRPPVTDFHDTSFLDFVNPAKTKPVEQRQATPVSDGGGWQPTPVNNRALEPRAPHTTIEDEKEAIIIELRELEPEYKKPIPKFNMNSDIASMRLELRIVRSQIATAEGCDFYRDMSLLHTGFLENINHRFKLLDMDLDGLSEHHQAGIQSFHKTFVKLTKKYGTPSQHPVFEYLLSYFSMAYSFHLAKKLANQPQAQAAINQVVQMMQQQQQQQPVQAPVQQPPFRGEAVQQQHPGQQMPPQLAQLMNNPMVQGFVQQLMPQMTPPVPVPPPVGPAPPVQRREMRVPTFGPNPPTGRTLERQGSGASAAVTEDDAGSEAAASVSTTSGGMKEISISRGRGRGGRRGRGRTVVIP